ncbi:plasmid mobilization protein [Pedobacter sp. GR22-6]|uniref:plasmid mobilization protein n=1 Tax=Pedobacter sp. GR22-6 TaxID=3127957 RepID=UPI00307E95FD
MKEKDLPNKSEKRTQWMHIRLTPKELEKLRKRCNATTSRDMSSYIRNVLLSKPVTVITRSQSMDQFIEELIFLRNELSAIGSNVNQQAKKINSIPEHPDLKLIMTSFRILKVQVDGKITHIKDRLNQFADQWLQESSAVEASEVQ